MYPKIGGGIGERKARPDGLRINVSLLCSITNLTFEQVIGCAAREDNTIDCCYYIDFELNESVKKFLCFVLVAVIDQERVMVATSRTIKS